MIEKFKEWYDTRHEYSKNWKEKTGGKILGYFCTYVPEEILYAADVLPVRILGSHEPQNSYRTTYFRLCSALSVVMFWLRDCRVVMTT